MLFPAGAERGADGGEGSGAVGFSHLGNELARLDQALGDLRACEAAEVALVGCGSAADEHRLAEQMTARARRHGFATATLSLTAHSLDALDLVVRGFIEGLVSPEPGALPGLLAAVRAFAARHSTDAAVRFARAAERWGAVGDLTTLCAALLVADTAAAAETELGAWLLGTELGRVGTQTGVRGALTERTARRALAELTRLLRCLGCAGTLFCLIDGDRLARRTPRQRERAYTLLRELIDNFDGGRGMLSTRLLITGGERLFAGPTSLGTLPALASRLTTPSEAEPPPPHRSFTRLSTAGRSPRAPRPVRVGAAGRGALRTLIRVAQGLPPTEAVATMSVGHERIDAVTTSLLEHARISGSVFSVLTGDYGTGKTHLLLSLADRALDEGHPVLRLNLERLNLDLGNPARHLHRLLGDSELPAPRRPSALEWLARLTRSPQGCAALEAVLADVAAGSGDAAAVARRALRVARSAAASARGLEAFLGARDLESKSGSPSHRRDAYGQLLLWLELWQRLEQWQGPVLLIDEAENLYVSGASRTMRRTALRSLAFYCGGALPSTCVVMTTTPRTLAKLRYEAGELLHDVSTMESSLEWEDAEMLRRRLMRLAAEHVPALTREHRAELVARVVATHAEVRGRGVSLDTERWLDAPEPPRQLIRRLVDALETAWWRERWEGARAATAAAPRSRRAASESTAGESLAPDSLAPDSLAPDSLAPDSLASVGAPNAPGEAEPAQASEAPASGQVVLEPPARGVDGQVWTTPAGRTQERTG